MKKTFNTKRTVTHSGDNGVKEKEVEVRNRVDEGAAILDAIPVQSKQHIVEMFELMMEEKGYLDTTKFNNFLHVFKLEIEKLEKFYSREEIVEMIAEIRVACAQSPFVDRVQNWPRGYQGDFETIDYIMTGVNKAKEATFGHCYENYFLTSQICQQHRNKVERQAQLIKDAINQKFHPEIISIGCGTSEDIKRCIPEINYSEASITLVDVDQDAIDFSLQRLDQIKHKVTALTGNIYRVMRTLTKKYDLLLIGGVFDYLNDKTIISVLSSLKNNLAESGKLFFTNIDSGNPYRVFMEYTGSWSLVERSQADLIKLIKEAGWPEGSSTLYKDQTGLTHLVELNN